MTPKVFITGVTGYIGGDIFNKIQSVHPDYDYAILVRTKDKGDKIRQAYPKVRIVLADLDNSNVLKEEAAQADIVIHCADASDHDGAAKAIAAGLKEGHSSGKPGFWLHTGGTGILTFEDSKADRLGEWSDKEYNDLSGVDELVNLPDDAFHRNVDKIVLEAGSDAVKTAIVCPPTIYGKGRGPLATRGRQVYELAKLVLEKQYAPIIGSGKARWNSIHVEDLSEVFLLLLDAAVSHRLDDELWNQKGYYFTENGEHIWAELSRRIASEANKLGMISTPKDYSLGKDEALKQAGFEAVSWGLNSRGKAERAEKFLGWKPKQQSIENEVPNILKQEKERLNSAS